MPGIVRVIDKISEITGRVVRWSIFIMMLIQVTEAVRRYVFNSPTIWAWEVNEQIFTAMVLLSGGYVLWQRGHVRLDLLYSRYSQRTQVILEIVCFPLLLLFLVVLVGKGGEMAALSWHYGEKSSTLFAPPLYPLKTCFVVGAVLLLLQAIADFLRNIASLRNFRKEPEGE